MEMAGGVDSTVPAAPLAWGERWARAPPRARPSSVEDSDLGLLSLQCRQFPCPPWAVGQPPWKVSLGVRGRPLDPEGTVSPSDGTNTPCPGPSHSPVKSQQKYEPQPRGPGKRRHTGQRARRRPNNKGGFVGVWQVNQAGKASDEAMRRQERWWTVCQML